MEKISRIIFRNRVILRKSFLARKNDDDISLLFLRVWLATCCWAGAYVCFNNICSVTGNWQSPHYTWLRNAVLTEKEYTSMSTSRRVIIRILAILIPRLTIKPLSHGLLRLYCVFPCSSTGPSKPTRLIVTRWNKKETRLNINNQRLRNKVLLNSLY